jgi:hypothetical protein
MFTKPTNLEFYHTLSKSRSSRQFFCSRQLDPVEVILLHSCQFDTMLFIHLDHVALHFIFVLLLMPLRMDTIVIRLIDLLLDFVSVSLQGLNLLLPGLCLSGLKNSYADCYHSRSGNTDANTKGVGTLRLQSSPKSRSLI